MPRTRLVFYKENDGSVPVIDFLDHSPEIVRLKLLARLDLLRSLGYELRRPQCDYLRDGIYELRTRHVKTQYRLLYFFYKNEMVVVSHGLTKEQEIPPIEINHAKQRAIKFAQNPSKHSYSEGYRKI